MTIEQEGFRFRNDDGSESTATWLAAQDTNASKIADRNFRLRFLLNMTGDEPSTQFQVEYKLSTDITYTECLTAAGDGNDQSITFVNASENDESGGFSVVVSVPSGVQDGDVMVAIFCHDQTAGTEVTVSGGAGSWTQIDYNEFSSKTTAIFYRIASSESGAYTFTQDDSSEEMSCIIVAFRGVDNSSPLDVTYSSASHFDTDLDEINPTSPNITTNTDGARVIAMHHANSNDITAEGAPTGYTLHAGISGISKNNRQLFVASLDKTTAGAETPGDWNHSGTDNGSSHIYILALKPQLATGTVIYVSESSNITASGENTTVQLTAPGGKTTGDFEAGRIQDDENPADAIDVTTDNYTEVEWCMQASGAHVSVGQAYDIRVTSAGTDLDTYTVTPQLTIASNIKTVNSLAIASVKTVNSLAIASVKGIDGLE